MLIWGCISNHFYIVVYHIIQPVVVVVVVVTLVVVCTRSCCCSCHSYVCGVVVVVVVALPCCHCALILIVNFCLSSRSNRAQTWPPDIHTLPDAGAGEGVPFQSVLDTPATHRDRARPLPDRAPDQDLVSESTHEVEEGEQDEGRARLRGRGRWDNATQQSPVGRRK